MLNELKILYNSFSKKFDTNVKYILKHLDRLNMVYVQA